MGRRRGRRLQIVLAVATLLLVLGGVAALPLVSDEAESDATREAAAERHLEAPPDAVWEVLTDFEALPAWRDDVASVLLERDPDGLPHVVLVSPTGARETWVVRAARYPELLTLETPGDSAEARSLAWSLTASGQGTRVRVVEASAPPDGVWARLREHLGPSPEARLRDDLDAIATRLDLR